jgi:peptidyl-prolyl cis-trans isomerase A (cyclophilin A)
VNTRRYFVILLILGLIPAIQNCASGQGQPSLMNPQSLNETAPDTFRASFETSAGDFVIEVRREWSPNGADRFYNLVKNGYYDDCRFFRVIDGFMVQFGINGDPAIQANWRTAGIADDPVRESNARGFVTFAMSGQPNSRTTQIFINFGNNANLDASGFAPFGRVVEGMDTVDDIYSEYGEGAPGGRGPEQQRIQMEGNTYLNASFPEMDYVTRARIVE